MTKETGQREQMTKTVREEILRLPRKMGHFFLKAENEP